MPAKSANIMACVEPEIKQRAESIMGALREILASLVLERDQ